MDIEEKDEGCIKVWSDAMKWRIPIADARHQDASWLDMEGAEEEEVLIFNVMTAEEVPQGVLQNEEGRKKEQLMDEERYCSRSRRRAEKVDKRM
jgi:hypothetical protein